MTSMSWQRTCARSSDNPDGADAEYFRSDAVRDKIDAYNEACSDSDETVTLAVFEQV